MINNQVTIVDVSFWQDDNSTPYKIDFSIMKSKGIDGAILRAGQNQWLDSDYRDYVVNADLAGIPRGAYWFYDSRSSPESQVSKFLDALSGQPFPKLGLWGDYEENYGGAWGGAAHFKVFMQELRNKFPTEIIGVYTGPYYWIEHTTSSQRDWFKRFPLWIAHYGVINPTVPYPWDNYALWQYTSQGDGKFFGVESNEIDMNRFRGTFDEYKRFFLLEIESPDELVQLNGGTYEKKTTISPRKIIYHLITANREKSEVLVTAPDAQGLLAPQKTSSFLINNNLNVGINGDEFYIQGERFGTYRLSMSNGVPYGLVDGATTSFSKDLTDIRTLWAKISSNAYNAISGSKWLVQDGQIGTFTDLPPDPRTALGYNDNNLFLLVVDGRGESQGMTLLECANLLKSLGATNAINLDGGSSSTMTIKDKGVVNTPSSGEVEVGNHFGIKFIGGLMAKNKVTITWDSGARERSAPSATASYRNILADNTVHYSDFDPVPDQGDPTNPDKRWIQLQSGWYIANRYPSGYGTVERAIVEPIVTATKVPFIFQVQGFKPFSGELERE